jgi:amidase
VPLLLKDLLATYAGEPMSSGSRMYQGWIPPRDSEVVRRLRRAGFIAFGKTNTPEFGLVPVTEPALWGPTRNPWNLERTCGGSSGGSAAAVAAGIVPLATGGDGGGSIRIPASCCGLFGLKPTRARTPAGPDQAEYWQGCAVEHVLARSVRDSAAALDALEGPDPGAPYHAPPPARPFLQEVGAPPGRLRIAFTTKPPIPAEVHPDCLAAIEEAAKLCQELGHDVEEADPGVDGEALARDFIMMIIGETAVDMQEAALLVGRRARAQDFEPGTTVLRLLAKKYTALDYALAVRRLMRLGRSLAVFMEKYDVLLTPTMAKPPIPVGTLMPRGAEAVALKTLVRLRAGGLLRALGTIQKVIDSAWGFTPFTTLFNVTGQPAMSVPLFWSGEGLPIGTQFAARFGDEATLFRLAAQLEAARPWAARRPPVSAF